MLSKGSTYLSQLADIDAIAFDKTGTLTNGEPKVTNYYFTHSVNEENIIDIIVALEKESNHPLANAILEKFEVKNKIDIEVTNQIGKGLTGDYNGKIIVLVSLLLKVLLKSIPSSIMIGHQKERRLYT